MRGVEEGGIGMLVYITYEWLLYILKKVLLCLVWPLDLPAPSLSLNHWTFQTRGLLLRFFSLPCCMFRTLLSVPVPKCRLAVGFQVRWKLSTNQWHGRCWDFRISDYFIYSILFSKYFTPATRYCCPLVLDFQPRVLLPKCRLIYTSTQYGY